MGENICKTCLIWVYTMYEELHRSVIKKTTHFKIWTEDLNRNFSKIWQWPVSTLKICSVSLAIREIQMKPTVKCYFMPSWDVYHERQVVTNVSKEVGEVILVHCWWACKKMWPCYKTVWQFLRRLNTHLHGPDTYLWEVKTYLTKLTHGCSL